MSATETTPARSYDVAPPEVVKWYTLARRFPQLIGKTHKGGVIWGGPYTYTQVGVGVALIVVGGKTTAVWGQFGLIGNVLILGAVSYGAVLLVGRLPIGARNPLWMAFGAIRALSAPPHGRLNGSPFRERRPHRVTGGAVISGPTPSATHPQAREPLPPAEATTTTPTPPAPAPPAPARSSVQRLLAASNTTQGQ